MEECGNDGERTAFAWDVGTFLQERSRVKSSRELVDEEKQAGIQGQRQQESPAREYLEQVKIHELQRIDDEERLYRLKKWNVGRI